MVSLRRETLGLGPRSGPVEGPAEVRQVSPEISKTQMSFRIRLNAHP